MTDPQHQPKRWLDHYKDGEQSLQPAHEKPFIDTYLDYVGEKGCSALIGVVALVAILAWCAMTPGSIIHYFLNEPEYVQRQEEANRRESERIRLANEKLAQEKEKEKQEKRASYGFTDTAISWSEARNYVGQVATFTGEVAAVKMDRGVIFIDIGVAYPDNDRLTLVVWRESQEESIFANGMWMLTSEDYMLGMTVLITGEVYLYGDGNVANIELTSPAQIRVDAPWYFTWFDENGNAKR